MTPKQQLAMAYDLALSFTKDEVVATELAESIIKICIEYMEEDYE